MMSLGVSKGGIIPPTDEDRRRIIKQMKVRTTLRGDKSWIHHHNSDSEDEKKSSPLSGRASGGSSAPKPVAPQNDRSPSSKPQSGYLIRGVFTKTIDKASAVSDSSSPNQAQKSSSMKGQSPGRSPSGYRMTTEDYKKLAPYNVRQKSVDGDEDVPFSPDEHKKRTEAANSVLRRSAGRERAYVLSAAKKSNGSPTQEFPPLFAKRIEIEEEEGQQRRSPSVPGSSRFSLGDSSANGLRKTTPGSSWDEPKTAAASPSSPTTDGGSQTSTSLRETPGRSSPSAGIRNGEDLNGKSSWGAVARRGDGDKALKEKPEPLPWDEAHRGTMASTNGSFPERTEANNGFYPPKFSSDSRDRPVDAADKPLHHYEPSALDVGRSDPAPSGPGDGTGSTPMGNLGSSLQPDVPFPPTERAPVHREDVEYFFKRSVPGYEEKSSSMSPEGPAQLQPHWNDFSGSSSLTERGQGPAGHGAHPELPRAQEPTAHEPSTVGSPDSTGGSRDMDKGMSFCVQNEEFTEKRSSSGAGRSSIPAPEAPHANESEPRRDRVTPAYEDQTIPTTDGPQDWRHSEPGPGAASRSDFSCREGVLSAHESQHSVPLHQDPQPFFGTAPSHRIPAYVDSQVFSTRRPTLDPEGRVSDGSSSLGNSRSDGARGHGEFTPPAGRHDTLPRDPTVFMGQRSHRVPFYMDSLNYNSTRLLSSSSERLSSPAGSGFHPDSSTAGRGILFVKEYVNTGGFSASPRYGSGSLVDLTDLDRASYSHHSYLASAPLHRASDPVCSYCSREIRDCPKIIIEHLNIHCHEYCFRCGICHKAMGDLLDKIFIHRDIVHCDKCYEKLF